MLLGSNKIQPSQKVFIVLLIFTVKKIYIYMHYKYLFVSNSQSE